MKPPVRGECWYCGGNLAVSQLKRDEGRTPPVRRCAECGRTEFPRPTTPTAAQLKVLAASAESMKNALEGVLALADADPRCRRISGWAMRDRIVDRAEEQLSEALAFGGRPGAYFLTGPARIMKAHEVLHSAWIGIRLARAKGDKGQDVRQDLAGIVGSISWAVDTLRAAQAKPALIGGAEVPPSPPDPYDPDAYMPVKELREKMDPTWSCGTWTKIKKANPWIRFDPRAPKPRPRIHRADADRLEHGGVSPDTFELLDRQGDGLPSIAVNQFTDDYLADAAARKAEIQAEKRGNRSGQK